MTLHYADCTEQLHCIQSQPQHVEASLNSSQSPEQSLRLHALKGNHHLLMMLQKSLGVFLLVVPHIDVPDTPRSIFGGCHHLGGIRCKSQAQYLTLVTLWQKQKVRVTMQAFA
jgi:hypothetical protein